MALKRVDIVYLDGNKPSDRVTVGVGEQLVSKRDLAKAEYADDEYQLYYMTWLAAKRERKTDKDFDEWAAEVGSVDPLITTAQIDELYAAGQIDAEAAERMKGLATDPGESQTPRTE